MLRAKYFVWYLPSPAEEGSLVAVGRGVGISGIKVGGTGVGVGGLGVGVGVGIGVSVAVGIEAPTVAEA
jgi:hypothetical protein